MRRILAFSLVALTWLSSPLPAQDDTEESGGFLVNLLQDNLSGENRYIKVTGLDGALSSRATIQKVTVSDDDGVWLTLSDAVLDWNRLALVRGRFSVNTLSAEEIVILRKPTPTETDDDLPAPEATPFQVPELPVAVEIGELRVEKVALGEALFAGGAELTLSGALSLADGTLDTTLAVSRLDRPSDELNLIAGFQNETSQISLDLKLAEAEGGMVTQLLDVPDRPSILLTAKGQGPVTDFTADIGLASADIERMAGQVRLLSVPTPGAEDAATGSIGFQANLAGDITPLLSQDYRSFFGTDLKLELDGRSDPDGRLAVDTLNLTSNALSLNGTLDIAGSGQIETLLLSGRIAPPEGTEVVLPMSGPRTSIGAAKISARLQAEIDDTWDFQLGVDKLSRPDMSLSRIDIRADGTLHQGETRQLDGKLDATLAGLAFADDALNQAIGSDLNLNGAFKAVDETAFQLSDFVATGTDYSANISAEIDGLNSGFRVEGRADVNASDLSRFSALAGQDLGGEVSATLAGIGSPLGGTFDFDLNAEALDLATGIAQIDGLIKGRTSLALLAARSETGLEIRAFRLDGTALTADATGAVRSGGTDLEFNARLDDVNRVVPQMNGPLTLKGDVSQTLTQISGTVRLDGPDNSFADVQGMLATDGDIDLTYDVTLNRTEQFLPQFPGTLMAKGTAKRSGPAWQIETDAQGPGGIIAEITGALDPSEDIALDLRLAEPAGGPVSTLLKIPERPSLLLTAKGQGPLVDFTADITLASDEVERLGGQIRLNRIAAPTAPTRAAPSIGFAADLAGDISPLLAAAYREFFGRDVQLALDGRTDPDGRVAIENFDLTARSMILNGALDLAGNGLVERAVVRGRIAQPTGDAVVLPLPGPPTTIGSAMISAQLGANQPDSWDLRLNIDDLASTQVNLARAEVDASGTLDQLENMHLTGTIAAALRGIGLSDPALDQAIGSQVRLNSDFQLIEQSTLKLAKTVLTGIDYSAKLDAEISGLDGDIRFDGQAEARAQNLARFSGLAGRPIGGSVRASAKGNGAATGETFDLVLNVQTDDLSSGIKQMDALVPGTTTLELSALRDRTGLEIRSFDLNGVALTADAAGALRKDDANFDFNARLDNVARVIPQAPGPLTIKGTVQQTGDGIDGQLRADGPTESFADLKGVMQPDGSLDLDFDATLARLERFLPDFPGAINAKGKASRDGETWQIDSRASGPGGLSTEIDGTVNQTTLNSDVTARGQLQLGIVNRFITPNSVKGAANFDLALKGQPALESLSGTISTTNTSVAIPAAVHTIKNLNANIALANGRADISVSGGLGAGGQVRITGPVTLAPPFDASILTEIQQLVVTDGSIYKTLLNGQLKYNGTATGTGAIAGNILIGETRINIAAVSGSLGAAPIPPIQHVGETGQVELTRARAGLIETASSSPGPDLALNVGISAPNKIFVTGRGLNAELGGSIQVRGTVANVQPAGQINLIRGRFDIAGRRLALSKGLVSLQGNLKPYMEFGVTSSTSDGTASLDIEGPLDAPKITITSDPTRPSGEALAMLVFGNQYSELSPLKIAQLAASAAQLSGAGGGTNSIREGLGVDDLDLSTDDDGNAQVGVGTYLADGVYTDVSVNTKGDTEVNLNLDVTDSLTLKGTVDSTGETGLGVFFERDY
ncbi:translocation/assembly module TamB domain-containing protein [Sedimentitalea nanhaiensis]|uniref:Autotransporter secretion inner membrane protein TamB n=1 Tax=Sedimentitalea nanhaiensis TaxID=999627 RepID=A0A1I7E7P2_9RHOB|nr:translocation/assembly module TamB domain-containing protein [Sedimentitalea nanhaiensis]SFU19922.1 autotransporter secretion inner membrane protein TamB [Sedimentitalea nanhaiensis]